MCFYIIVNLKYCNFKWARLRFFDAKTQEVIKSQPVSLRLNRDRAFTSRPDKDGWCNVKLNIPATTTRVLYIELINNNRIYKPNVITDAEGNVELDFYTADDPATYSVIIEGMSNDGKLFHYHGNSVIKVE